MNYVVIGDERRVNWCGRILPTLIPLAIIAGFVYLLQSKLSEPREFGYLLLVFIFCILPLSLAMLCSSLSWLCEDDA